MKIWWPWWRQERLLSLFERPYESQSEGRSVAPVGNQSDQQPYPKNAPGPFYVIDTMCMTCGAPHVAAPELMAWDHDREGAVCHCYFKKQPQTPAEIDQAVKAIAVSCCGALVYDGDDREIIKKLSS